MDIEQLNNLITLSFLLYGKNLWKKDGNPNNMRREKDSGEGIEGNWDYHPIYPTWPSAPPPPM